MKTLILSDELFEKLEYALTGSARGRAVLEAMSEPLPALPSNEELILLARKKGDAPERIARVRAYRDAGLQASEDTRSELNDLVVECYRAGVGVRQLSRWSGLSEAWIYELVTPARASA
jgi:hypothetical protein